MGLVRKGGTTILQDDNSIISIGRVSSRRLYDKFSGDAHQYNRVNISASQHAVKSCPKERAHARLSDHGLVSHGLDLIDNFQKLSHIHAGGGQDRDPYPLQKRVPWRIKGWLMINNDVDDQDSGLPGSIQDPFSRLPHIALLEHGTSSHGSFLNVHGEYRGLGTVETQICHITSCLSYLGSPPCWPPQRLIQWLHSMAIICLPSMAFCLPPTLDT